MSVIHVYSLPQVLWLTTGIGAPNMNYPVNRTDFRLYRGVRNTVEVYIRDIDRKPVTLDTGSVPTVYILSRDTPRVLLSRAMTLLDATKGHWSFYVDPTDLVDWPDGALDYVVTASAYQGAESMLYTDQGYGPKGSVTVYSGPVPATRQPIVVPSSAFLSRSGALYTSALIGSAQVQHLGVHTAALYATGFSGVVTAQGLLDASPTSDDSQWADITASTFTGASGPQAMTFEGNYYWVRFAIAPTSGTIDQIQFMN